MSIYYHRGSSSVLCEKLKALAPEVSETTLLLTKDELRGINCPDSDDKEQVLDFKAEGLATVWQVQDVRKRVEDRVLASCEVDVVRLDNPFPDELTTAGSNQALTHTTSAEYAAQQQSPLGLAVAGTYGIRSDGGYAQLSRVYWGRVEDKDRTEADRKGNPRRRKIGRTELLVDYRYEQHVTAARLLDQATTCPLAEYQKTYTHIEGTLENHLRTAKALHEGGDLPAELAEAIAQAQEEGTQASTQLVTSSNPDFLRGVVQAAERNRNTAGVLRASMERNLTEVRNRMAAKMATLNGAMEKFKRQMEKVQRLIVTLELYLGVHENLMQIAQGEPAPEGAPITLRQLVLYADEEFGDPRNGGLTFRELAQFDAWLVDSGAYKQLAPEARCVVAIKPRRKARVVDGDLMPPMLDDKGKALDSYTYLLLRNGDNLYRIQTPNVEVATTLFPLRSEFQKLLDRMSELSDMEEEVLAGRMSQSYLDSRRNTVEADVHGYQKSIWLLQGLLFRTDVLHPLPVGLNLMKPETYGNMVQFVHDAEVALPSGRLSFDAWQKDLNSRIKRGSRVLAAIYRTRKGNNIDQADFKRRFTLANLVHNASTPPLPKMGVYSVDYYDEQTATPLYEEVTWAEATEAQQSGWRHQHGSYDYDLKDWVLSEEPATLRVPRYDAKGRHQYEEGVKKHLVIRYNPGDAVTVGGWGREYSQHGRKNTVGFKIRPNEDEWLFNYDELTLDDINFYLTDRIERQNYATMMPFLYELRDHLEKELKWEREFTKHLTERLGRELADQLPAGIDLVALATEAIQWYKLEKVQIKRSLTNKDTQALSMVEQRIRYYLRERYKLKGIDANVDYRNKTLIWHHKQTGRSFVGTGFLKSDFVDECLYEATLALPAEYAGGSGSRAGRVTSTRIEREMHDTLLAAAVELAATKPLTVLELTR